MVLVNTTRMDGTHKPISFPFFTNNFWSPGMECHYNPVFKDKPREISVAIFPVVTDYKYKSWPLYEQYPNYMTIDITSLIDGNYE